MEIEQKARESIVSIRSLANLVRKHGPSPSFADSLEKIADHLESALRAKGQEETPPLNEPFGNSEQLAEPVSTAYTLPEARRWPFVESPGEFTERLARAMQEFPLLGAVRHVLIENPPTLSQQPAAPSGEAVASDPAYRSGYAQGVADSRSHECDCARTVAIAAPQQPAAADEFAADRERLLRAFMMECGIIGAKEAGVNLARGIKAALAAQQQEGE